MRRSNSIEEVFTFGGRVPSAVGALITAFVIASVAGALGADAVRVRAALLPGYVWRGEIWRLVTWSFVETDPLSLIFGAMMLYMFGRDLCFAWGPRRFLVTFFGITAAAAAATCILGRVAWPVLMQKYWLTSWPIIDALVVAWAMIFPERQILLMFALPVSGRALLGITVGGTLLWAIFNRDFAAYVPHLLAQALMVVFLRGYSPRGFWQTLRIKAYERRARRRASHLKVIRKEDPPRWMN
jgi:membrane associated rhomboid family serine protease